MKTRCSGFSVQRDTYPSESFDYDADGNLTDDGVYVYAWDGENRLICVAPVSQPVAADKMLALKYDYLVRRVDKVYSTYSGRENRTGPSCGGELLIVGFNLVVQRTNLSRFFRRFFRPSHLGMAGQCERESETCWRDSDVDPEVMATGERHSEGDGSRMCSVGMRLPAAGGASRRPTTENRPSG